MRSERSVAKLSSAFANRTGAGSDTVRGGQENLRSQLIQRAAYSPPVPRSCMRCIDHLFDICR
jgi:hypothetical protein